METLNINGYTVEIEQDVNPIDPRHEYDCLGKMICFHKKYVLGDKHDLRSDMFGGWDELESHIKKELNGVVILPLYLMDHSGISMSTGSFNDPWDSGQVGFIYMDKKTALTNFKYKTLCKSLIKEVTSMLLHEVTTYDQYLRGDMYGFTMNDQNGKYMDSCWGYFGDDFEKNGLMETVRDYIENYKETVDNQEMTI